jgi:hypothetical protein
MCASPTLRLPGPVALTLLLDELDLVAVGIFDEGDHRRPVLHRADGRDTEAAGPERERPPGPDDTYAVAAFFWMNSIL